MRTADQIGPFDPFAGEFEAPVRAASFGFQLRLVIIAQSQSRAVIDGRASTRQRDLALAVQFVCRLVAGIEQAHLAQLVCGGVIFGEPVRLAEAVVPGQAQQGKVGADAVLIFLCRAFCIGVINAQNELSLLPLGEQPVDQRRAHIANVQAASGGGCKANNRCSHGKNLF